MTDLILFSFIATFSVVSLVFAALDRGMTLMVVAGSAAGAVAAAFGAVSLLHLAERCLDRVARRRK